jgi:CDP-ribitol ribitolphosphotransferase
MQYFLSFAKIVAKTIYFFMKLLLPIRNKVVMISRFNYHTSIDFKLLYEEIKRVDPSIKVVILNHKPKSKPYLILQVLDEMFHLATSKYCIVDSYVIPVSILKHNRKLVIIQIWHALGAIKKFGYASLGLREGSSKKMAKIMDMHKNYDYVICGSEAMIPFYKEAFNVDESIIMPYSLPRVDYLLNKMNVIKIQNEILGTYPVLEFKKTILYAPTFRKRKHIRYEKLIEQIDFTKYNLIIKKHPHDKTKEIVRNGIIYDTKFDAIDLITVADYVISDYSAIFFEASILEKPMYFYIYDINKYKEHRSLFIKVDEEQMPGIVSESARVIINAIENDDYDIEKIRLFKNKYISILDRTSAKKIVSLFELENGYEKI